MPNLLKDHRLMPASGFAPNRAIIFLHGLGDRGDGGLLDIGRIWLEALPGTVFLCPDAPFAFDMAPPAFDHGREVAGTAERAAIGRQWFSLRDFDMDEMRAGALLAAPHLNAYIDHALAEFKLTPDKLVLAGFSQGTMMALFTAPRRARPVAGIVGYSGVLLGAETLEEEMKSKPPVLLVHGTQDPVVPFRAMAAAEEGLRRAGIPVKALRTHCEHTIDGFGVSVGLDFIKAVWGL